MKLLKILSLCFIFIFAHCGGGGSSDSDNQSQDNSPNGQVSVPEPIYSYLRLEFIEDDQKNIRLVGSSTFATDINLVPTGGNYFVASYKGNEISDARGFDFSRTIVPGFTNADGNYLHGKPETITGEVRSFVIIPFDEKVTELKVFSEHKTDQKPVWQSSISDLNLSGANKTNAKALKASRLAHLEDGENMASESDEGCAQDLAREFPHIIFTSNIVPYLSSHSFEPRDDNFFIDAPAEFDAHRCQIIRHHLRKLTPNLLGSIRLIAIIHFHDNGVYTKETDTGDTITGRWGGFATKRKIFISDYSFGRLEITSRYTTIAHEAAHAYNQLLDGYGLRSNNIPESVFERAKKVRKQFQESYFRSDTGFLRSFLEGFRGDDPENYTSHWRSIHQAALGFHDNFFDYFNEYQSFLTLDETIAARSAFKRPYGASTPFEDVATHIEIFYGDDSDYKYCKHHFGGGGTKVNIENALSFVKLNILFRTGFINESQYENCVRTYDIRSRFGFDLNGIRLADSIHARLRIDRSGSEEITYLEILGITDSEGVLRELHEDFATTYDIMIRIRLDGSAYGLHKLYPNGARLITRPRLLETENFVVFQARNASSGWGFLDNAISDGRDAYVVITEFSENVVSGYVLNLKLISTTGDPVLNPSTLFFRWTPEGQDYYDNFKDPETSTISDDSDLDATGGDDDLDETEIEDDESESDGSLDSEGDTITDDEATDTDGSDTTDTSDDGTGPDIEYGEGGEHDGSGDLGGSTGDGDDTGGETTGGDSGSTGGTGGAGGTTGGDPGTDGGDGTDDDTTGTGDTSGDADSGSGSTDDETDTDTCPTALTLNILSNPSAYAQAIIGNTTGDLLGQQMLPLDFNGDGIRDLAIASKTAVFVFYGPIPPCSSQALSIENADLTLDRSDTSETTFKLTSGDFNRDGITDLVIGSPRFNRIDSVSGSTLSRSGRLYVVLGSASLNGRYLMNEQAHWVLESDQASAKLGQSLLPMIDFNNDGHDDLIFNVTRVDHEASLLPAVYLVYNLFEKEAGTHLISTFSNKILGESLNNGFGDSLSHGDVNNDGNSDLLLSAANHDGNRGKVYLIYGQEGLEFTGTLFAESIPTTFSGANPADYAGKTARIIGDINGDSFAEIALGIPGVDLAETRDVGEIWVLFGNSLTSANALIDHFTLDSSYPRPHSKITGTSANQNLGETIHGPLDINHDGIFDLSFALPEEDQGKFYYKLGQPSFPTTLNLTTDFQIITGEQNGDEFGMQVFSFADINGDGIDDLVFSAPQKDQDSLVNTGQVYYLLGF